MCLAVSEQYCILCASWSGYLFSNLSDTICTNKKMHFIDRTGSRTVKWYTVTVWFCTFWVWSTFLSACLKAHFQSAHKKAVVKHHKFIKNVKISRKCFCTCLRGKGGFIDKRKMQQSTMKTELWLLLLQDSIVRWFAVSCCSAWLEYCLDNACVKATVMLEGDKHQQSNLFTTRQHKITLHCYWSLKRNYLLIIIWLIL